MVHIFLLLTLWVFRTGFGIGGDYVEVKAALRYRLAVPVTFLTLGFMPCKTYIKGLWRTGMPFIFLAFIACNRMYVFYFRKCLLKIENKLWTNTENTNVLKHLHLVWSMKFLVKWVLNLFSILFCNVTQNSDWTELSLPAPCSHFRTLIKPDS